MSYILTHGKNEQTILEQCYRQRKPLPAFIENAPELYLGLEMYFDAFFKLTTSRGSGAIGWQVVHQYCAAKELSEDQIADMHYFIEKMDIAYMKHQAELLNANSSG